MSVKIESNGTWTAQAWYHDYHGKRRHKTKRGFSSKDEARAWERDFLAEARESVNSTMEAFYEVYAEDMMPRLREHTWHTKKYMIEGKILLYFGRMRVDEIEPIDVVRFPFWNATSEVFLCTHAAKSVRVINIPRLFPSKRLKGSGFSCRRASSLTRFSPIPRRIDTSSTV